MNDKKSKSPILVIGAIILTEGVYVIQFNNKLNAYAIPLGKVEKNELPENALKREMFEELNIFVNQYKLLVITNKRINDQEYVFYIYKIFFFTGIIINKEPEKHKSLNYMSKQTIDCFYKNKQFDSLSYDSINNLT